MKKLILVAFFGVSLLYINAQTDNSIFLLVRGDDIRSSHATNLACIESYRNGIMRSVELMVPGPWFLEAVRLLNENPGLDVGVHLVLTSEWNNIKWRPLTCCPSLMDKDGYFYPMGCESCAPEIATVVKELAVEYELDIYPGTSGCQYITFWNKNDTTASQRINSTVNTLKSLKPGRYFFIDHPGIDNPEMRAIWHKGYENVAADRDAVTKVFTSKEVLQIIQSRDIHLINYKESVGLRP
jgi:hypothetical protein